MTTLNSLALDFIGNTLETERTTLKVGWHDPQAFHAAACDAGLTAASWADPMHAYIFWHVCSRCERDIEPNFVTCLTLAEGSGAALTRQDLFELTCFEPSADPAIHELCEIVAANALRRERARECLTEGVALLSGQPFEVMLRRVDEFPIDGVELVA
jgi:hypothetical protein